MDSTQKIIQKYNNIIVADEMHHHFVPEGWYDLVNDLLSKLSEFENIKILQIKEKFGGLRIYYNPHNESINSLIAESVDKSYKTCIVCGKPAKLKTKLNWIEPVCDDCAKIHNYSDVERTFKRIGDNSCILGEISDGT